MSAQQLAATTQSWRPPTSSPRHLPPPLPPLPTETLIKHDCSDATARGRRRRRRAPSVCVCTVCVCVCVHPYTGTGYMHFLVILYIGVCTLERQKRRDERRHRQSHETDSDGGERTKYCRSSSTTGMLSSSLFSLSLSLLHPSFNLHASPCFSV